MHWWSVGWPQWWSFADVSQQGLHFSKKSAKENIFFVLTFTDVHMGHQKVPKSDFQSHFYMSKIIRIFLIFFFTKEYQFRRRFLVIVIFWKLQYLNHFVFWNGAQCEHLCESQIKKYFHFTDFFAKIYSLLTHIRKTEVALVKW